MAQQAVRQLVYKNKSIKRVMSFTVQKYENEESTCAAGYAATGNRKF
jgi:hypothetical protein